MVLENGKIPAIVDHLRDNFSVFERAAIMLYLGEHYDPEGKLLSKDSDLRSETIQWLMFQVGGLDPVKKSPTD
ncbi:4194_t:CDS:2 [Paraglomus occultum]|uniref:4194_t:CDS:1 n=1 Tax=Paraglomus occultum TaxID=144539 RepID=A0A9N9GVF0_9GLOM|nr:4194_t:CDS:2 [Paraglomus occultum]